MKKEDFETSARAASKAMEKKKAPTRPETQFMKGALWAWDVLMAAHTAVYYEEVLRQDVCDRFNVETPHLWQESLIHDTAVMMADRDGIQQDIWTEGRLLLKFSKSGDPYKESNPLYVHLKELQRTIGMQREHLGLSAKSAKKMESPRSKDNKEDEKLNEFIDGIQG